MTDDDEPEPNPADELLDAINEAAKHITPKWRREYHYARMFGAYMRLFRPEDVIVALAKGRAAYLDSSAN